MSISINLNDINREEFIVTEHEIGGKKCTFIRPQPNFFDWRPEVMHFRSSVWETETGKPVSLSYKKFFNFEEKPAIDPFDGDLTKTNLVEKLDGSTLIVSRFNGQTILRTRGTVDAQSTMPNGDEVEIFRERHAKFFRSLEAVPTFNTTFLFEWLSPRNRIVLDYGQEPRLVLCGAISHEDYSLWKQSHLDAAAKNWGLDRPKVFNFPSVDEMLKDIKALEGYEGICMYYNNDQNIRKIKSTQYLRLHAFKSNLSLKNLAEVLYHFDVPEKKETFLDIIEKEYDFECAVAAKPVVEEIYGMMGQFRSDVANVKEFVSINTELDQKSFAVKMIDTFSTKRYLTAFGFSMRKGNFAFDQTKKAFLELLKSDENGGSAVSQG